MGKMRNKDVTHKIMSAIKSKDTKPELLLRKELWRRGFRYRIHYDKLPGKPDVVMTKYKIVIFCDGDYWHGHNWALRGIPSLEEELEGYSEYWKKKIKRNVERDTEITKTLNAMGWKVIRIWESDIKKDLQMCIRSIEESIFDVVIQDQYIDEEEGNSL